MLLSLSIKSETMVQDKLISLEFYPYLKYYWWHSFNKDRQCFYYTKEEQDPILFIPENIIQSMISA